MFMMLMLIYENHNNVVILECQVCLMSPSDAMAALCH